MTAGLSSVIVRVQHHYYRAARDRCRWTSVNQIVHLILAAIMIADLIGVILIALR
ncbi:MAG: hypothetical protein ACJ74O_20815 [Frankiaceae bacterium]